MLVYKKATPVKACQYTGTNHPEVKKFLSTYTKCELNISSTNGAIYVRKNLKFLKINPSNWLIVDTKTDNNLWIVTDKYFQAEYRKTHQVNRTYVKHQRSLECLPFQGLTSADVPQILEFLEMSADSLHRLEADPTTNLIQNIIITDFGSFGQADYLMKDNGKKFVVAGILFDSLYQENKSQGRISPKGLSKST